MNKIIVCRMIAGQTEYLANADDTVMMFDSEDAAKAYLSAEGMTEGEIDSLVFLESCGICRRCGSPLFPSLLTKDGYTYQCFTCDEDFYAFEQNE